jgi:uncharacterized membrane protein YbhN (UPF0104 family)
MNLQSLKSKLANRQVRSALGIAILVATVLLFINYGRTHPGTFSQIGQVGLKTLFLVLFLYTLFVATNAVILFVNVQMCSRKISYSDGFLLTAYSTLVNFFGPLQSGPGFRAVYVKNKFGISLKSFGIASLFYYGFYAIFSLCMLLLGFEQTWIGLLVFLAVGAATLNFIRKRLKSPEAKSLIHPRLIASVALVTFIQVFLISLIYFTELRSIDASISFKQAVIYTGAANFGMFVSLTPGAIGIRESFLLFAERLHHIPESTVLAASLLDRGIYFIFLGGIFALVSLFHVQRRLSSKEK